MKFDPKAASMIAKLTKSLCGGAAAAGLSALIAVAPL